MPNLFKKLDQDDEYQFRVWFKNWAQRTGINPNPDDPSHFYDFRGAWNARVVPSWNEGAKTYEWPKEFDILHLMQNRSQIKSIPNYIGQGPNSDIKPLPIYRTKPGENLEDTLKPIPNYEFKR